MSGLTKVGAVVIGRNEGERLARCLASVRAIPQRVYVDSGSVDDSVHQARQAGFTVIELTEPPHFTAARARNAGLAQLLEDHPDLEFVQMVDGDCELQPGWIESGVDLIRAEPGLAAIFGRLRERHVHRSIYHALSNEEWNGPAGVGGNALFRMQALCQVGFYNAVMIAGEDSELAMRLRKRGWEVRHVDAEMAVHDIDMTDFRQWWKRSRRTGHAYAEMALLHPDARNPNWPRTVRSIVAWGGFWPLALAGAVVMALLVNPWWSMGAALVLLLFLLNTVRLIAQARSRRVSWRLAGASGLFLMIGKVPQMLGLLGYYYNRLHGRASPLIEYKAKTRPSAPLRR